MADEEKTEQPTDKRISDARKRGQVPRSRELGTFMVMFSGVIALWVFSSFLGQGMERVMEQSLSLTRDQIFSEEEMGRLFIRNMLTIGPVLLAICVIVFICSLIGNAIIGGINFSQEAMQPKFNKLNPLSGVKRIFSVNSLVELVKSIAKVACIGLICFFVISGRAEMLLSLSFTEPRIAIGNAITTLFIFMLIIVCAMLPIVLIDVPWQKYHYIQQLRMSKQEIKDEFKQTEGSPEIKSRIKRKQYEIASSRMMANVPTADVVVTNPTHYAAALKYDPLGTTAPTVVAKGVDEIAAVIKDIAREAGVPVVPLPPLARSLYYTTEIDEEIPRGLFQAVAQVLAWVMAMKAFREGKSRQRPRDLDPELPIPEELRF